MRKIGTVSIKSTPKGGDGMEVYGGYIKLFRQIVDWEWYDDIPTCRLFIHLLLKVNHADRNWQGKKIERGSCITSFASLSTETKLSVEQIKRALKNLQKTGEIKKISTNQNTLIIVTKYDDYQCFTNADNKQTTNEQQTDNMQKTNGKQTDNKRTTTNKNEKNDKNIKNNSLYCYSDEELKINQIINTVIEILNIETDKKFSPDTKLTRKLIQDRLNDGYALEDFKLVIEKKCDAWKSDPIMESYLKPSILFGPKFDEYLNE